MESLPSPCGAGGRRAGPVGSRKRSRSRSISPRLFRRRAPWLTARTRTRRTSAAETRSRFEWLDDAMWVDTLDHGLGNLAARREGNRWRRLGAVEDALRLHRPLLLAVPAVGHRVQ